MTKRLWSVLLLGLGLLLAGAEAAPADNEAKAQELQTQRTRLLENIAEAEKLAAEQTNAGRKAALNEQIGKWRTRIAEIDRELAGLRGEAAPAAGDAAPTLDAAALREIARVERQIRALLVRIQARAEEIKKTPANEPLPGMQGGEGFPGAEGGGEMPLPPVQPGAGGLAPGEGGEGMAGPLQPTFTTRRGKLEWEQKQDLDKLIELKAKLKELQEGPKQLDPLAEDNRPELNPLRLYGGDLTKNEYGAAIGAWGSGSVEEAAQGMLEGLKSLLVFTDGYYRGARLDFATPPDIATYWQKAKSSYFEMDVFFFPKQQATTGGPGSEGAPTEVTEGAPAEFGSRATGAEGGMNPGEMPGMLPGEMPGAFPGAGGEGMPGFEGEGGLPPTVTPVAPVKAPPATRSLRLVLDTDRGPVVAEDVYFDHTYEYYPGWTRVFVPLEKFVLVNERAPAKLNRLRLFGDTQDAFYIGQIRLIADEVPIKPTIVGYQRIEAVAGEELKLQAFVEAGLSLIEFEWDWGDGDKEATDEPIGEHLYVRAGTYTVTLTARDKDGLKQPGQTQITVIVKPFADTPAPAAGVPGTGALPGSRPRLEP